MSRATVLTLQDYDSVKGYLIGSGVPAKSRMHSARVCAHLYDFATYRFFVADMATFRVFAGPPPRSRYYFSDGYTEALCEWAMVAVRSLPICALDLIRRRKPLPPRKILVQYACAAQS
jgi:hypothetical protein